MNRRRFLGSLFALLASTQIRPAEAALAERLLPESLEGNAPDVLFRVDLGSSWSGVRGAVVFSSWLKQGGDSMWTKVSKRVVLDGGPKVVEITSDDLVLWKVAMSDHGLLKETQGEVTMVMAQLETGSAAVTECYIPAQTSRSTKKHPRRAAKRRGPQVYPIRWWEL